MKKIIGVVTLLGVVSAARSDEKQVEKMIKEVLTAKENLVDAVSTIKDKPSAVEALPKLLVLDRFLRDKKEAWKKLDRAGVSVEFLKLLGAKFGRQIEKADAQFDKEYERIEALPEAYSVVKDMGVFKFMNQERNELVQSRVETLTLALELFKIRYERYPNKLEELVKPPDGRALLESLDWLKDPWDQPYEYDPKGPKNEGRVPDIWSHGSRHKDRAIIGNWMKK